MQSFEHKEISVLHVLDYISKGFSLALSKECRLFVIIPITINFLVLALGGYLLFHTISAVLADYLKVLPEWLNFLTYIIWFFLVLTIGFVFCYIFSTIANIIAAPFYGLLAEKAEECVRTQRGETITKHDEDLSAVVKDIPRILKREMTKLAYYLPRALICLIISFIPVLNLIAPICWFILGAWMLCVQYTDYIFDNHKISFKDMQNELKKNNFSSFLLGVAISLGMMVPFLNMLLPPAAVCAGVFYYLDLEEHFSLSSSDLYRK